MGEPRHFRLYFRWCAGLLVTGLLVTAILNYVVDPKMVWGSPWGPEFLSYRDQLWDRTLKAELLRRARADVLIIGTSVAESAIDPAHPVWRGRKVFNSGWVSSSVTEIRDGLEFAIRTHPPEDVYYVMDFDSFNDHRGPRYHYYESRLHSKVCMIEYYLRAAVGMNATVESLQLLKKRWDGAKPERYRINGFHAPPQANDQGCVFESTIQGLLQKPHIFGDYKHDTIQFRDFRGILRLCRAHNIKLTLIIAPTHASHLEAIHAAGLWPRYEMWKRRLTHEIERDRSGNPRQEPFALWDFSGYGEMRSEPYLSDSEDAIPGKWFIDPAHPSGALGALMIDEICGSMGSEGTTKKGLGRRLNAENLDSVLAGLREERTAYLDKCPPDHDQVYLIQRRLNPSN